MGDEELLEFYNRQSIQRVLNKEFEEIINRENIPTEVKQEKGKAVNYYLGLIKEKKSKKTKRVMAREEEVSVRGKKYKRFRDSKGRWAKVKL